MKVIGFTQPGSPDVLQAFDLPAPEPAPGEVLVRVHAAAVNPTDTAKRAGERGDGVKVPGMDAAGVLEAIGPDTDTDLAVGDEVMAIVVPNGAHGAYSEKIALPAESVVRAPRGTTHVEAATVPMNALTARLALDTLALAPGQTVAVTGAAGAMGGYAVQLAKADGLRVVADAAEKDKELVTQLGADTVLPRGADFAERVREEFPDGVDGLIDGAVQQDEITGAVRDGGAVISVRGYDAAGERGVQFRPIGVPNYAREHAKLDALRQQVEDGQLSPRVAEEFPAEQAKEAHRRLEGGGVRGRLVLTF